jgi:hypothetical protein
MGCATCNRSAVALAEYTAFLLLVPKPTHPKALEVFERRSRNPPFNPPRSSTTKLYSSIALNRRFWRRQVSLCNIADRGSPKRLVPWDMSSDTTVARSSSTSEQRGRLGAVKTAMKIRIRLNEA